MSTRKSEHPIDAAILNLSGGLLDGILRVGSGGAPLRTSGALSGPTTWWRLTR